jgi:hypothetical protein
MSVKRALRVQRAQLADKVLLVLRALKVELAQLVQLAVKVLLVLRAHKVEQARVDFKGQQAQRAHEA